MTLAAHIDLLIQNILKMPLLIFLCLPLFGLFQEKGAESLGQYKNLYRTKKELKYGGKAYSMELNFVKPITGIMIFL
jgi:hypothetical protein